jgi:hypothetical protein
MGWKIQITCPDCTGQDYQGCGEGHPWDLDDVDGTIVFDTKEAAEVKVDSLERENYGGIWEFEVLSVDTEEAATP